MVTRGANNQTVALKTGRRDTSLEPWDLAEAICAKQDHGQNIGRLITF